MPPPAPFQFAIDAFHVLPPHPPIISGGVWEQAAATAENVCIIRPEDCEIAAMLMSSTEICYITKTRMVKFAYTGGRRRSTTSKETQQY